MKDEFICEMSHQQLDSEWDDFVETTPDGDFLQSSYWATFKAPRGWLPIRLIFKKEGCIVGGVQVLVRQLTSLVKIAHVLHGPVLKTYDPELLKKVIHQLIGLIQTYKIHYLGLEPTRNCCLVCDLGEWGFRQSRILRTERASLVIDLTQGSERVLRQMRRTTRNNIGRAERLGIRIREGNEEDVSVFYNLLEATSRRRQFRVEGKEYYLNLWRLLEGSKHVKLFMAEYNSEVLSSLFTIPFGNTVLVVRFAWIGNRGWLRPNELLFWKAIECSMQNGFSNFDFGGVNLSLALAFLGDRPLSASDINSDTRFVLGFGGSLIQFPSAFEYVPNRSLRLLLRVSATMLGRSNLMELFHRVFLQRVHSFRTDLFASKRRRE